MEAQTPSARRVDFRELPIVLAFFVWWFKETPAKIIYIGQKTVGRAFEFFSITLLLKSLFSPWKRDETDTSNMALEDKVKVLMMNLVSRLVGAVVRSGTILVGLLIISATFLASLAAVIGFILLPIILVYFIARGLMV